MKPACVLTAAVGAILVIYDIGAGGPKIFVTR